MKKILKGFTLAEVMIVLTVIGILAGILIPVANNSRPDENVMKFKKAHATLMNVVHELVTSDKYFKNGDLGLKANGELTGRSDFCLAFADVLSTKKVNCDYETDTNNGLDTYVTMSGNTCTEKPACITGLDTVCIRAEKMFTGETLGVLASDNIYYFEQNLRNPFGCIIYGTDSNACTDISKPLGSAGDRLYGYESKDDYKNCTNTIQTLTYYKRFCIDIDGLNKGEDPFGYGIRVDGKIILGERAKEWLEKGFQKREKG